mmetsp:Transcript_603/g.1611  ORF Transcript_603/g.1611 Transcript_603/m.1611 type:complete len:157 (+) Transcript_603:2-472(+)
MAGALAARLPGADVGLVQDVLRALAAAGSLRQEYMDAALARLRALLAREPHLFKPSVLARLMGTIGWLEVNFEQGDSASPSARAGANPECQAANARLLRSLSERVADSASAFLEADFPYVHELYVRRLLGEEARLRLLARAEQLGVPLPLGRGAGP